MAKQLYNQLLKSQKTPKIIGLALNYGQKTVQSPSAPVIFTKPLSCIVSNEKEYNFPGTNIRRVEIDSCFQQNQLWYELEIGVLLGKQGKNIPKNKVDEFISGYFLCQDVTDATMFKELREKQFSWELCKGRDNFLPVSDFIEKDRLGDVFQDVELELKVNGEQIYRDSSQNMLYKLDEQISYVSQFMQINEGDMFLSGTPKPGPFKNEDLVEGVLYKNGQVVEDLAFKIDIKNQENTYLS